MAIDKSYNSAPLGMLDEDDEESTTMLDITIATEEDPVVVELDDGGVEVSFGEAAMDKALMAFGDNLADYMGDSELDELATELIGLVEADIESRKDWADTFAKGMDVLGMKYEERSTPWQGACGVHSTVLAEAAIRFQAETMSETFPAAGPVRVKVLGEETKDKQDAAERVKADMNYELTEVMVEYRPEHERMLYSLGLAGSAFKKVYYDPAIGRQVAIYIPAEDIIVPYGASHINSAERVTHVMRKTQNEMAKLQAKGFYRDIELGDPEPFHTDIEERKAEEDGYSITEDDRYALYEVHADLVIDGFGSSDDDEEDDDEDYDKQELARPYIVTIERGTSKVLAIRRNWEDGDVLELKRQHFVHYVYVPGFGFYGLGLIHIIGGYARAGTSLIRQLVDAGTLSNLPGGLKSRGLRIKGDDTPIEPGEWKDVDVPSGSIRDNIMPLPYKEPSQTLLQLLNQITTEGRRLGAISDMNISDMSANAPVGTTLALLERTLKPMAAVQARVHYAMKQEFKLLKEIIAEYAPMEYSYRPTRGAGTARQSDYAMVDVIPVSDPNSSTMAQRVVQYQAALQMAKDAPQIYDLRILHRQMLEVIGIKNSDKIIPIEGDELPVDPISENMNILTGKPVRAFLHQDADAHIAVHTTFMQDPMVAQTIGQNPMAQQMMAALQAHIAEHLAFKYRKEIEQKLGVTLPPPNEPLPEGIEVTLSKLMADAATQNTAANKQQAQAKQAEQKAQDPVMQLQQRDQQVKEAEAKRKADKDRTDAQIAEAKLALEGQEQQRKAAKDAADAEIARQRLMLDAKEAGDQMALAKQQAIQAAQTRATGQNFPNNRNR